MKSNKKIISVIIVLIALLILFVPYRTNYYNDGGTTEYVSLTYTIVKPSKFKEDQSIKFYFNFTKEKYPEIPSEPIKRGENDVLATILEIDNDTVLIKPIEGEEELNSSDKITFSIKNINSLDVTVGDIVQVTYTGDIMESYPAQIDAVSWQISNDLRHMEYTEEWLDKSTAEKLEDNVSGSLQITKIYSNCFFAVPVAPLPGEYKFNGTLSDEWCVGDQIICVYKNVYYNNTTHRTEGDMVSIDISDWEPDPNVCYKPVIYLYPEKETDVSVKLNLNGELTCTYPKYSDGWKVTAFPDGTLKDKSGKEYNYLYWEGETNAQYDLSKGFCVKGEDTAAFLENALDKLGLTRKEANEFIVYWLPLMENNPYNIISFQTDAYTDIAKLNINPTPDTLIRVFMTWQKSDSIVDLPEQKLIAPNRNGFTVVEWGGTEIIA